MTSLRSITLQSPGTLGLNTQDKDDVQDPRYCTQATNCVISRNGLLESRQGAARTNATAATGTPTLDVVYSYVQNDGTEIIVSAGGNKLWSGTTSLADETGALTVTDDNWQFQNYAGEVFGYNGTDAPIYWDGAAATFATIASKGTAAGIVSSKCHLSAFGRSWVVDTTTVSQINYSDLLVPEDFTNGSAGTIDLNTVWPYSNDTITCLAAHNNNLIIFCEKSIVIYGNADNINNIFLVEVIRDIGCIARDSVQNVGDDIFFLSNDGVRSLGRTILQDNMPQKEISASIRDDMIDTINSETSMDAVRSTYNEKQGFYLINFPSEKITYVCDVRTDQPRWTTWDTQLYGVETSKAATDELYFGLAGGFVARYTTDYYDTDTSDGSLDQTYVMKYRSAWFDPGFQTGKSIWKKMVWYIASLANFQAVTTWSFDFDDSDEYSEAKSVTGAAPPVYGTATYGTATYGGDYIKNRYTFNMKGVGSLIRTGFQATVGGGKFAFNKIDLFMKLGRIR